MQESIGIEKQAADNLLHKGVRVAVRAPWFLRVIGKKNIHLTIKSPFEGTMHRVAGYYLSTGITSKQLEDTSYEEAMTLMHVHGHTLSKAVACAILNGYWSGKLLTRHLAAYLRWNCRPQEITTLVMMLLVYGGTQDFMNTTRSVRMMKITTPRLGQMTVGS